MDQAGATPERARDTSLRKRYDMEFRLQQLFKILLGATAIINSVMAIGTSVEFAVVVLRGSDLVTKTAARATMDHYVMWSVLGVVLFQSLYGKR